MKIVILVFLLSCNLSFGKVKSKETDKDCYLLKGPVQTVFTTKFHATSDSTGKIIKGEFYDNTQKEVYGSKLLTHYYSSIQNNSLCQFDRDGNVTTILYFRGMEIKLYMAEVRSRSNDSIKNETIYFGDEVLLNYRVILSNGFPSKRILITERNDTMISKYTYLKDKVIKDEIFMKSELGSTTTYDYNSDGKISHVYFMRGINDTSLVYTFKYNKEGYTDLELMGFRDFFQQTKFDYKYDRYGNWISRHEFKDGKLEAIVEREIEYY
jgi:hypothetical protein